MTTEDTKPTNPSEKDPIVEGSLLWPIFLGVVLLLAATGWALYDEAYSRRPYKGYQNEWVDVARRAYSRKQTEAQRSYDDVLRDPTYVALRANWDTAREAAAGPYQQLQDELNKAIAPRLAVLQNPVKETRSRRAAEIYRIERSREKGEKNAERMYRARVHEIESEVHRLDFPGEEPVEWAYQEMVDEFNRLKERQGDIQGLMAQVKSTESAARAAMNDYLDEHIVGPKPEAIQALLTELDTFEHEIKQIHIALGDGELVERCESCHLGIRSPVPLSLDEVGGRREFVSHPNPDLLKTHDPEVMGCTPCHGGNGFALDERGHGRWKYWLWPLHYPENVEAGCLQCHERDRYLPGAETFNKARQLFQWRGCVGCHRHDGFTHEEDELKTLASALDAAEADVRATEIDIARLIQLTLSPDLEEAAVTKAYADRAQAEQSLYLLRTTREVLDEQLAGLNREVKRVGPNLKEVSAKLKPSWLQPWLARGRDFRPDTKMPQFRIDEEQAWNIAAFIWQSSDPVDHPTDVPEGDAEKGEWLITVRGCLGCHTVTTEEFPDGVGAEFASNLSRMGEKANYAYLASWIQNPRHHNPKGVMPSLRLSDEEARDIASFLVGKQSESAQYPEEEAALAVLNDAARFPEGQRLVKHLGCAGCHEIQGLEYEDRIGTELTQEGSIPLERLDFGTLTHKYHAETTGRFGRELTSQGKYRHKWFFEDKLRDPSIWDTDKYKPSYWDRLKMPEFWPAVPDREEVAAAAQSLDPAADDYDAKKALIDRQAKVYEDIDALTTLLLGSVDSTLHGVLPQSLKYDPVGMKKDVQEGWWVIKKYNCDGCHEILPGVRPEIWDLPIYEDGYGFQGVPDKNGRPPTLVGQGTRTSPDWLMKFLENPALTHDPEQIHRNGVRQGLNIRMPTFELSARERGRLTRFFTALANLSGNYQRPQIVPLEGEELDLGRAAFVAGDCANCHLLGGETEIDPATTYAPSFEEVAERIKPSWIHPWVTVPSAVIPGTAMPALLTPQEDEAGNIVRWVFAEEKISGASRTRLGDEMLQKLTAYEGDHGTLLMRYFAQWNETEAEYQRAKREIR
jgi:cytochrome c2